MSRIQELEKELKKEKAKQTLVTFYSPGSFLAESTSRQIASRDVKEAVKIAGTITERHQAKPYGFRFTDGNGDNMSGTYYITGTVIKYDDIPDTPKNEILRSNCRNNHPVIIENTNSWKFTGSFDEEDFLIDQQGNILDKGTNYNSYRREVRLREELNRKASTT